MRRLELFPTLISLVAFTTTLALGFWQLERLRWKEELIAKIEAGNTQTPLTTLPGENWKDSEFKHVRLKGAFLKDTEFHHAARYFQGTLGYDILVPFRLQDKRLVLVNRGWVPADKKEAAKRPETAPGAIHEVVGIVRTAGKKKPFLPPHNPEKNLWFWYDAETMGKNSDHDFLPLVIEATGTQDAQKLPVPSTGYVKLRNDHFAYAITWFGIALGIAIIFFVYHRNPDRGNPRA